MCCGKFFAFCAFALVGVLAGGGRILASGFGRSDLAGGFWLGLDSAFAFYKL
ncbi:hypothetical protein [Helicobacter fennelliae]|uniref:hypothetical protein n=1 Tax=Helicobacter fennelliae TaxID=215 RepID=UPI00130D8DC6|nr:hypothetical protein [Helicobacter fennelliae]